VATYGKKFNWQNVILSIKNKIMKEKYSIEEKLMNLDLHGLPCRVPIPTEGQAKCSHTRVEWVTETWENWATGEKESEEKFYTVSTYEDIPGTNNLRCTKCGYTRRY